MRKPLKVVVCRAGSRVSRANRVAVGVLLVATVAGLMQMAPASTSTSLPPAGGYFALTQPGTPFPSDSGLRGAGASQRVGSHAPTTPPRTRRCNRPVTSPRATRIGTRRGTRTTAPALPATSRAQPTRSSSGRRVSGAGTTTSYAPRPLTNPTGISRRSATTTPPLPTARPVPRHHAPRRSGSCRSSGTTTRLAPSPATAGPTRRRRRRSTSTTRSLSCAAATTACRRTWETHAATCGTASDPGTRGRGRIPVRWPTSDACRETSPKSRG